jgi:hypothetical protein
LSRIHAPAKSTFAARSATSFSSVGRTTGGGGEGGGGSGCDTHATRRWVLYRIGKQPIRGERERERGAAAAAATHTPHAGGCY